MIKIDQLTFAYRKQPALYNQLTLDIQGGSIVGLLGKNGAGKTTLLKLIAGLLQTQDKGSIETLGFKPGCRTPELLRDIFFIPEEFELPSVSMKDYVSAIRGFYPGFDTQKMDRILLDFELDPGRKLNKLSYGQKKKFLISVTLSCGSKLLILDEPTNGLDIPSKAVFRKVISGALTEDQLVLISTHQVKDIETIIDKVIIVDQGTIILNHSIYDITEKFSFKSVTDPDKYQPLYQEAVPGGYKIVTPRNGEETDLDIEILFNAATKGISFD
ncbi:ATP-binding cassette domain-containing protein [Saccharicrinis sp. FJH2]|uniref:ABC transporter ATP-binding protein n=1 Tax=Saccharicrinis sp. FJH65 TaxID=3344659 RepID=UPI0035F3ABF8